MVRGLDARPSAEARLTRVRQRPGDGVAGQRAPAAAFELVSGSQRRQVCQTPFGGDLGDEHEPAVGVLRRRCRSGPTATISSRRKSRLTYVVRSSRRERNQRVLIAPRRTSRPALTSKMSAKSDSISISIVRRTGPPAVVDDVEVLVDAARRPSGRARIESVWRSIGAVVGRAAPSLVNSKRAEKNWIGDELRSDRPLAVDEQLVAGHEAGVAGEEAVLGQPLRSGRRAGRRGTRSSRLMVIVEGPTWIGSGHGVAPVERVGATGSRARVSAPAALEPVGGRQHVAARDERRAAPTRHGRAARRTGRC